MTARERNNVNLAGSGTRPMVFIHGYGCDQTMWRFVTGAFEDSHRLVLYDLTGMGRSDLSAYDFDDYRSLRRHARDTAEILEELDLRDAILVGHSVGATIAALAALEAPDRVAALALVAPSPCFMNNGAYTGGFDRDSLEGLIELMDQNYLGWAGQVAPTITGAPEGAPATAELTQSFCRTDPAIAKHLGRLTFLSDHREDMTRVAVPTLIVQCDDDALAPVAVGEWLAANMPAGRLDVIRATGHCPHLTEPDKTRASIAGFLADRG